MRQLWSAVAVAALASGAAVGVAAERRPETIKLQLKGEARAKLTTQPQVFCYVGDEGWSPLQLLGVWAPLRIHVASSSNDTPVTGTAKRPANKRNNKNNKGSDTDDDAATAQEQVAADGTAAPAIATRAASEDDLHHAVEGMVLRLLSEGGGDSSAATGVDAEAIVTGAPSRLPRWFPLAPLLSAIGGAGACPRPWASDRSSCDLYASQYGRTCVAVSAASGRSLPKDSVVTVTTSCALRPELLTLLGVAALLLFMSGEFGKSKLFQYAAGAGLGVTCGALLLVVSVMRKRAARSKTAVAVATVAYAGGVLALLRSQAAHAIASHWEFVLAYVAASAAFGLFLVRVVRSHPEHKHRLRVVTKWLVRLVAVFMVQRSTYSGAIQALYLAALFLLYARYALTKNGFFGSKRAKAVEADRKFNVTTGLEGGASGGGKSRRRSKVH